MSSFEFENFMNVPLNLVAPFASTDRIGGAAMLVTAEVITAKILRKFISAPAISWAELAFIHLVSLPFLGGPVGFFDVNTPLTDSDFQKSAMDGLKGVPAVLLSQFIVSTANVGYHVPKFNMRDVLVTAAAKVLTRPLLQMTKGFFPKELTAQLKVMNRIVQKQAKISIVSKEATEL